MRNGAQPSRLGFGVLPKFIHLTRLDSRELLTLCAEITQQPCPHCHQAEVIKRHGYSKGYPPQGDQLEIRRIRFFVQIAAATKAAAAPSPYFGAT